MDKTGYSTPEPSDCRAVTPKHLFHLQFNSDDGTINVTVGTYSIEEINEAKRIAKRTPMKETPQGRNTTDVHKARGKIREGSNHHLATIAQDEITEKEILSEAIEMYFDLVARITSAMHFNKQDIDHKNKFNHARFFYEMIIEFNLFIKVSLKTNSITSAVLKSLISRFDFNYDQDNCLKQNIINYNTSLWSYPKHSQTLNYTLGKCTIGRDSPTSTTFCQHMTSETNQGDKKQQASTRKCSENPYHDLPPPKRPMYRKA